MGRTLFILFALFSSLSCDISNTEISSKRAIDKTDEFDLEKHLSDYEALKKRVLVHKVSCRDKSPEDIKEFMFHLTVDSIWPYWYGTEWDYNGITETPRQGLIACGYFVTTTLRDGGVKLQRYKLAQQASSVIVQRLCEASSRKTFTKLESLEHYLEERGDNNLYVLGLDNHVGFVIRDKGVNYFVHADYTRDSKTKREELKKSIPVKNSNILVIGSVLDNSNLVDTWLSN